MQQSSSWVPLFPEQASTFAWQVDALYFYLILISIGFTIPIVVGNFLFLRAVIVRKRSLRPAKRFTAQSLWKPSGQLFRS